MRSAGFVVGALLSLMAFPPSAGAEDEDWPRFYFGPRIGYYRLLHSRPAPGIVSSDGRQAGVFAGMNLNAYFGLELAGDHTVLDLSVPGRGKMAEYGIFTLLPQVRARYPLRDAHLVPYVLAGIGISHNEFKDRKEPAVGVSIRADGTTLAASVGGGLEYLVAPNIVLGVEAHWLMSRDQTIQIGDRGGKANLDAFLAAINLRLLVPDVSTVVVSPEPPPWRPYIGLRVGGETLFHQRISNTLEAPPENASIGPLNLLINVAAGVDLGRYFGVELAAESYSHDLKLRGVGTIKEYAIYNVLPELRLRYPMLGGAFVPYGVAGVGGSYGETKDDKGQGFRIVTHAKTIAVVGVLGAGLDSFIAHNIALGLETKYVYSRDHHITFADRRERLDLDAVVVSLGVRIYLR
jgi:opacity protein-like surface antigen